MSRIVATASGSRLSKSYGISIPGKERPRGSRSLFWHGDIRRRKRVFRAWGKTDVKEATRLIAICLEAGVNFFDTADIYSQGLSEKILGEAIRQAPRERILISTKATFPFGDGPNNSGSSRHHLTLQIEGSLKRLKTDYIDVYHMHGFDARTPIEETLSTSTRWSPGQGALYRGVEFFRLAHAEIAWNQPRIWMAAICGAPGLLFAGGP